MAVASSADRIKIEANLRVAGIGQEIFKVITSGEDVVNKKPSPDIYLDTARKMGVSSENCIVIEDALNGVQAAKRAGMRCIGVATSFSMDELKKEGADYACESIGDVYGILKNIEI